MNIRTDLALESAEIHKKSLNGVALDEEKQSELTIWRMEIETDSAAKRLGKPQGRYITIELPRFTARAGVDKKTAAVLAGEISRLLPQNTDSVLIAGLGNTEITPDSLGPKVAEKVIATRHIGKKLCRELGLGELLPVSVIAPGVLGQTGIETGELILGAADRVVPSAVIVIDALAARSLDRLGSTVQMSDTGICPGSGVGNSRMEISCRTLGIPVISVGVPTVVDIRTLLSDIGAENVSAPDMIVTPKEIDMMIERAAFLIAVSLNLSLQKSLSFEDIMGLI